MKRSNRPTTQREAAGWLLGAVGWASIAVGYVCELIVGGDSPSGQSVLVWTLAIFFAAQLARLTLALRAFPSRRVSLSFLLVAVLLWATGSALLNQSPTRDITKFPAPGEILFLASYVAMAAYLIADGRRSVRRAALDNWLQVVVVCGGTVCLTGAVFLTPVAHAYGRDGIALLLALLYPLIDLILAALVIGQAVLRLREGADDTARLVAGFLAFTFADSFFVTRLASHTYAFPVICDAAWGAGFALIVGTACRTRSRAARSVPRRQGTTDTVVSAAVAIVVLALRPSDSMAVYLTVPAVLTLIGAAGRLAVLADAAGPRRVQGHQRHPGPHSG